ncbi:hypothetical protein [Cystobacter fuscus]|uniref:YncE family protein n=1 Tax=Cystobacter fuscus TaxID=43 RepID=UPI002B2DDBE2|nr:hypothetical protein F0U63_26815 [Cystobacter fuscus]
MNRLGVFLAVTGAVWAQPAAAWDSICYNYKDATADVDKLRTTQRGCEGIEAARGRWRDPDFRVDEHRGLFEVASKRAGLPATVLETVRLSVLTGPTSQVVRGATGDFPTVAPTEPGKARRAVVRAFSIDEFAQLPDFSYALWDWARGNETCPLDLPVPLNDPQACHVFKTHMGAVNSNHFPPQSDQWFDYYHRLALDRATTCRTTRAAVWNAEPSARREATDARFAAHWRACEVEALAYEAVAQHYLQDSWSAGHMWERWGSTHVDAFPAITAKGDTVEDHAWNDTDLRQRKLVVAEMVAALAGTIHGSDAALFEAGRLSLHDPLCYPHEDVLASRGGAPLQVVGDLHLHDVVSGLTTHNNISSSGLPYDTSVLSGQSDRLLACVTGALGAVYAALGDLGPNRFGPPVLGASTVSPPPFDREACRALSVTNRAFNTGINEDLDIQLIIAKKLAMVEKVPKSVEAMFRNDYSRLRTAAYILGKSNAKGTEMASLEIPGDLKYDDWFCSLGGCHVVTYTASRGLFKMVDVEPNRCYSAGGGRGCGVRAPEELPAPFADPALTGPLAPPDPSKASGALALAFHLSRAPQLCNAFTASDLAALPALVASVRGSDRDATCDACAEFVVPFLRMGTGPDNYDKTAEPLCAFSAANPRSVPYLYEASVGSTNPVALARRYCGCKGLVAATGAGLQRLGISHSDTGVRLSPVGTRVPVGSVPRDVAAASGGRLLVTNSVGEIVGVREDTEVDLDGNADNGITRLSFPGISDLQGVTVANIGGKELVLATSPIAGELIAYDLNAHRLCDRVLVGRVSGEGAYDVVMTADGTKLFVSLRKTSPLSGGIAVVTPSALARCDGSAAATLRYLAPPGAVAGLGPMALSPDGSRLAVGGRYASTCLDQILNRSGEMLDIQVGCDRVFIMDVATETFRTYGTAASLPTRPGRYPYAVAWFGDSTRIAYATFQGIDAGGISNSAWPMGAMTPLPLGGTLRLADTSTAAYQAKGAGLSRYWTYNIPLDSTVIGESVVVDGNWVYVGTSSGRISAYQVAQHDASQDPFWEGHPADPETSLHNSTHGSWYGGCYTFCEVTNGPCPSVCPEGSVPAGFGSVELGSNVRALMSY